MSKNLGGVQSGNSAQLPSAAISTSLTDQELAKVVAENIATLDRAQLALISRFVTAMKRPIAATTLGGSEIATPVFTSAVGHYLSLHHATQSTALNKKGFEFLFQFACEAAGREAKINPNSTDANADVIVDGVSFSLKTQADKAVKSHSLYIQKLMEARWLRDLNTSEALWKVGIPHILNHLQKYSKIIVLKAYPPTATEITYELVEIPKSVFQLISNLTVKDFATKNKFGSCSVSVPDANGKEAFRLLFDGSVEKIRIFNLRTNHCLIHARWSICLVD